MQDEPAEEDALAEAVGAEPSHFIVNLPKDEQPSLSPRPGSKPLTKGCFSDNVRELALRCPHISEQEKAQLDFSLFPLIAKFGKRARIASRKFFVIKILFAVLSVLLPAAIGMSDYIDVWIGKTARVVTLALVSVALTLIAKFYQSVTKAYASYQTGFELMRKETYAFFFKTNEYAKHTRNFRLYVSRILQLNYELSKTEIVTSPVDQSDDSMRSEIEQIEKALLVARDEDTDLFVTKASIPFVKPKTVEAS